jgi:hypothetical protein
MFLRRPQGGKHSVPPLRLMNSAPQPLAWAKRLLRLAISLACVFAVAVIVGAALNRAAAALERSGKQAGFGQGMLQGALMPMSMPSLLVGRDVKIYAQNNTGRTYKLGYTAGVNACGAIFFGYAFWRWKRLREALKR